MAQQTRQLTPPVSPPVSSPSTSPVSPPDGAALPPPVAAVAGILARRRLGRATLLLLAAHQPMAFFAGQCLYFLAPLYRMFTPDSRAETWLEAWADMLSQPDALRELTPLLLTEPHVPPSPPHGE